MQQKNSFFPALYPLENRNVFIVFFPRLSYKQLPNCITKTMSFAVFSIQNVNDRLNSQSIKHTIQTEFFSRMNNILLRPLKH